MKRSFAVLVALLSISARSSSAQDAMPAATQGEADGSSTNAVDIKKLLELPNFTNSVGMVMVKVSSRLWAGKYLVTQAEYSKVLGVNPSHFKGERNPVDSVSWNDAQRFCAKLSSIEKSKKMLPDGYAYNLPTQGQWDFLMDGATLDQAVTSVRSNRRGTAAVGSLAPNSLGLYDTRGNVWQFCLDHSDRPFRVLRGAAWDTSIEVNLRPEFRWYANGPEDRKDTYGFRCIMAPAQ